jgi:dTDP-4-amino-4,6-dideoxygalactose transaminase
MQPLTQAVEFYRHAVGKAELDSVRATLDSVFLASGPRVAEFEERFAELVGAPHVVAVSSCSMGLMLLLTALGIGAEDEVITSPVTFVATSNAILHAGATPVFADCDPATGLLDPEQARRAITPRTKAIVCVHLYGQLCDMRALRALADEHGLFLIEDAAHAIEAERDGIRPGGHSDGAVFSFYATKNLTSGDGGAIAVRSKDLADRLKRLRNHGVTRDAASRYGASYRHWDMSELGFKAPMTDIEAALLLPQLEHLAERRAARQDLVERYERELRGTPGVTLVERSGRSAHHLFAILVEETYRDRLLSFLGERRIGCAVNYRAVHELTYYRERFGHRPEDFPCAMDFGRRTVSLPLWPRMPQGDLALVVSAVREMMSKAETRG